MLINKQFKVPVAHNNYEGPSQTQLYLHDSRTGRVHVHMVGIPEKGKIVIIVMFNGCENSFTFFHHFLQNIHINYSLLRDVKSLLEVFR